MFEDNDHNDKMRIILRNNNNNTQIKYKYMIYIIQSKVIPIIINRR